VEVREKVDPRVIQEAPTVVDAGLAAVDGSTRIRDIVHAFPWSLELLFRRGVTPSHGNLTLAEVAALNRFRVDAFVEALRDAAAKRATALK
jgi:hypothetical protein